VSSITPKSLFVPHFLWCWFDAGKLCSSHTWYQLNLNVLVTLVCVHVCYECKHMLVLTIRHFSAWLLVRVHTYHECKNVLVWTIRHFSARQLAVNSIFPFHVWYNQHIWSSRARLVVLWLLSYCYYLLTKILLCHFNSSFSAITLVCSRYIWPTSCNQ